MSEKCLEMGTSVVNKDKKFGLLTIFPETAVGKTRNGRRKEPKSHQKYNKKEVKACAS